MVLELSGFLGHTVIHCSTELNNGISIDFCGIDFAVILAADFGGVISRELLRTKAALIALLNVSIIH